LNSALPKSIANTIHSSLRSARVFFLAAILVFAVVANTCFAQSKTSLTVSAAASLKDALVEVEAAYKQNQPNVEFSNNFAGSGTLAAQIDQGAPVDIFVSAAAKQMDDLEAKGLLAPGSRHNLLRNTLVLIAPLDSKLSGFQGLTGGDIKMIALGDPASVPAGQYGRQTLIALHLLDKVSAKIVFAKDVRQVLTYVETGNADAGLVYGTDAKSSGKVRVVATAPETSHDAILYPEAVLKGSRNQAAAHRFADFLGSPAAANIFVKYGFTIATP
jgi:molybdate transport system substrate-binding protein